MQYSALFLKLLERKGISDDFLYPKYEKLSDPFLLPDMEKAVCRIEQAIKNKEKVLIYGDYDVDGVTATAIMHEVLRLAGVKEILMMLPDRFEDGYGMSEKVVKKAIDEGVGLVVTVDCGSNNGEIIRQLDEAGIEVVATDHHEVMGEVPVAVAVVNPKRTDLETQPSLKKLCGAGVAFFLARALTARGLIPDGQEKWLLDLAMIGTICDAMELVGENRIICRYGMIVLAKTRRVGLRELMKVAGVKKIDTNAIGFQLGPRLNAAGRMDTAELALRLLLTKSEVEAAELARELEALNSERRKQQEAAMREIEAQGLPDEPVLVVAGKWHEGILGIIAGNLMEKYKKIAIVLTEALDGTLKGSGRSFGEFNLAQALGACSGYIINGGGHAGACGLKLEKEKLAEFSQAINEYYRSLGLKNQERFFEKEPDLTVGRLSSISLDFMGELELLEPFGEGNEEPKILLSEVRVNFADLMGSNRQHLKLTVSDNSGSAIKLLAFNAPDEWLEIDSGEMISVLIRPMVNEWNGVSSVEGQIIKISRV